MSANLVKFTAVDTLVHHTHTMRRGDTVDMAESTAKDLAERGLGTYDTPAKQPPVPANKMNPDASGTQPATKTPVAPAKK